MNEDYEEVDVETNNYSDGGPAFPLHDPEGINWIIKNGYTGMSLRDYYIGQAAENPKCVRLNTSGYIDVDETVEEIKVLADAAMKARGG